MVKFVRSDLIKAQLCSSLAKDIMGASAQLMDGDVSDWGVMLHHIGDGEHGVVGILHGKAGDFSELMGIAFGKHDLCQYFIIFLKNKERIRICTYFIPF